MARHQLRAYATYPILVSSEKKSSVGGAADQRSVIFPEDLLRRIHLAPYAMFMFLRLCAIGAPTAIANSRSAACPRKLCPMFANLYAAYNIGRLGTSKRASHNTTSASASASSRTALYALVCPIGLRVPPGMWSRCHCNSRKEVARALRTMPLGRKRGLRRPHRQIAQTKPPCAPRASCTKLDARPIASFTFAAPLLPARLAGLNDAGRLLFAATVTAVGFSSAERQPDSPLLGSLLMLLL